jgi:hypothetical protein
MGSGTPPVSASRATSLGFFRASLRVLSRMSMTSGGVPLGADLPWNTLDSQHRLGDRGDVGHGRPARRRGDRNGAQVAAVSRMKLNGF